MQTGGKRGGRGVVVKDRTVIQGDAPWEAGGELGEPQHQLIGLQRRIGGTEAGIALDLKAADHIQNADQTDFAHVRHVHAADAASSSHSSCGAPSAWIAGVGKSLCF